VRVTVVDPLGVIAVTFALWLFGSGVGLILSVGNTLIPEVGRVVSIVLVPLHLMSGIFFTPSALPPEVRQWLILNPIMQAIDLLRGSFMPGFTVTRGVEIEYVIGSGLLTVLFGLALHVRFARRLIQA